MIRRLSPRGYAMPLVLILLLLLSGALTTALLGLNGSIAVGESALHRRQAFHAAEGVQVAAVELASQKLRSLPLVPSVSASDPGFGAALATMLAQQEVDVAAFVNGNRDSFTVAPFSTSPVGISGLKPTAQKVIGSGPFAGMVAQAQSFRVNVSATREHERSPATATLVAEVERATISMFQFYVFSDSYLDLDPGGPVTATGRIHTNGDFCIAGEPKVDTVTAAGRVLISNPNSHGLCRRRAGESNNIKIATDDNFSTFRVLTIDNTSASWPSVESDFNRHLLDRTHNVGALKMPISGQPRVQAGANVLAMERVSSVPSDASLMVPIDAAMEDNTSSMRFLVDPMLMTEPDDVRRQKFAFKADIRIIDGVWFLRDQAAPEQPGTPIWTDHVDNVDDDTYYDGYVGLGDAGALGIISARLVGQDALRSELGWGSTTTPQLFSYYGFKDGGDRWTYTSAAPAVISYGLLHNLGGGVFRPGHYSSPSTPVATAPASTLEDYLEGARGGIKNGWIEARSESNDPDVNSGASDVETKRSRLLPINFDVAAFIGALKTCTNKELGSYFPGSCSGGGGGDRSFNGVVYISSTWPGSMDGLGSTPATSRFPKLWPFQPADDNDRLLNSTLPMSLCAKAARPLKDATGGTVFPTTPCTNLGRSAGAFPNFVRVINAAHINPPTSGTFAGVTIPAGALPGGLTIATNLPIAVVGDANIDTNPQRLRGTLASPDYFVPFLIAGDRFHRHSNNWSDANANWRQPMRDTVVARVASDTRQHLEILAGWNPTPTRALGGHDHSSDGFEDFPRYNERWNCAGTSATASYFGSIVVAFASVYEHTGANNDGGHGTSGDFTTCFPRRDEGFDFHLEDPVNQPPGAPLILTQSVSFVGKR
jgi:hypothetical protein